MILKLKVMSVYVGHRPVNMFIIQDNVLFVGDENTGNLFHLWIQYSHSQS